MKRFFTFILTFIIPLLIIAQGWPANYSGVMLQGFYWDSYSDTKWTNLESQADELSQYFDLIWVPQSGWTNMATSMGYNDVYWYNQTSSFGNESELKSMINTYKNKNVGIIADVVINHRGGVTRWTDFPTETNPYDNKTYSMGLSDICNTDEYNTSTDPTAVSERATYGKATGAADTGEDFNGYRDLDHTGANVQTNVKAYLKYLLNYLGYTGFRYDMVKGYSGKYTGMYNDDANPTFSVGECWDGVSVIGNWFNATNYDGKGIRSAAFDFPQKYLMNDQSNYANWYSTSGSLDNNDTYKRYGVTFVDNHDTYRDNNKYTGDVPSANAWIIANPGTPCIFLPHWKAYKSEIGPMIKIRKAVGITNTSNTIVISSSTSFIEAKTTGTNGDLYVVIGDITKGNIPNGYTKVLSGTNYAYYTNVAINIVTVDKSSGIYDNSITTTINATGNSTYVYTTDGSTPTATNGTQGTGSKSLTFTNTTTLKVGSLVNGVVTDIQTYTYTVNAFKAYKATIYVNCDAWTPLYFYVWDANNKLNGDWPGKAATSTTTIDGEKWYYQTFDITSSTYTFNFIFSKNGSPQTVDITGLNSDKFYELGVLSGTTYTVNDVTNKHTTGIDNITNSGSKAFNKTNVYSVDGRLLRSLPKDATVNDALGGLSKGVYIVNDKKFVNK